MALRIESCEGTSCTIGTSLNETLLRCDGSRGRFADRDRYGPVRAGNELASRSVGMVELDESSGLDCSLDMTESLMIEQGQKKCFRRYHRLVRCHCYSKRKHPRRSFDREEKRRRMRRRQRLKNEKSDRSQREEKRNELRKNAEAEKEEEEKSYSNKSVCFFLFLFISTSLCIFNYVKVFKQTNILLQ